MWRVKVGHCQAFITNPDGVSCRGFYFPASFEPRGPIKDFLSAAGGLLVVRTEALVPSPSASGLLREDRGSACGQEPDFAKKVSGLLHPLDIAPQA